MGHIKKPLVSVCMITYNHEAFIAQAIEGVLAQQTNFRVELVIGEDCSKDGTRKICEQYAEKHPDIIRLLPSETNFGALKNFFRTLFDCRGKYIAICDGDDYWTDPLKLQDQADFLEQNPDYGMVYTDVVSVSPSGDDLMLEEDELFRKLYKGGDLFFSLLHFNFINTCTVLLRSDLVQTFKQLDDDKHWYVLDHYLWLRVAGVSKIHFMNRITACYRIHPNNHTNTCPPALKRKISHFTLFDNIMFLDEYRSEGLNEQQITLVFRKLLSLLYRWESTLPMRWQALRLLIKYFPGIRPAFRILISKTRALNHNSAGRRAELI